MFHWIFDIAGIIAILILIYILIFRVLLKGIEKALMDGKQIEISNFLYIIRLKKPANFCDISDPELRPIELEPGIYELICVPSLTHVDKFFWAVATDDEIGISPTELQALIAHGKAEWLKKPTGK